jgi:hypothetical protein
VIMRVRIQKCGDVRKLETVNVDGISLVGWCCSWRGC